MSSADLSNFCKKSILLHASHFGTAKYICYIKHKVYFRLFQPTNINYLEVKIIRLKP